MLLVEVINIKKNYGDRTILEIETLKIYSEDRIGIIGLNGCGKTTLMNILAGELIVDEGIIKVYGKIGYITQLGTSVQMEINKPTANKFSTNTEWKATMSGGEKTRFKIAQVLEKDNNIIFADEPTSNLDMDGTKLLENRLKRYKGALVLVSHDRELIDKLCNKILEIEEGKINIYNGNYSSYKLQKADKLERKKFEYEHYLGEKQRLENSMLDVQHRVKTMNKTPKRMGNSEARLHRLGNQRAEANLDNSAKRIKSRIKQLEVKEKPRESDRVKFDALGTSALHRRILISGRRINKSYGNKKLFIDGEFDIYNCTCTAILGPNGCGKTTLIKMIISSAEGIIAASGLKIGYFSQELDILNETTSIIENVLENSIYDETFARNILSRLLFKREDVYKKISLLSGGERVKVSFAKMFLQDINMLILDEPTNYLDIYSMEAVEEALLEYDRTILFVSHDRHLISKVAKQLLVIENSKINYFNGTYEEYISSKEKKDDKGNDSVNNKIFILQNKLSELVGKLSLPGKKDDIQLLDIEYKNVLSELQTLKRL